MTRLLREHPSIDAELDGAADWSPSAGTADASRSRSATAGGSRRLVAPAHRPRLLQGRRPHWLALVYLDRLDGTWHLERLYD